MPAPNQALEIAKLVVSIVALVGTLIAATIALISYRRTETWKRAEFLAREMKEFFAEPRVQKILQMIDWGARRIQLLDDKRDDRGMVRVTRQIQLQALLPHTVKRPRSSMEESADTGSNAGRYSPEEAAIRDCYDGFLDGLARLASYATPDLDLTRISQLRPFLGYWIETIHETPANDDDAAWLAALIAFIHFYKLSLKECSDYSANGAAP